jgi:hypothetical protein
VTVRDRVCSRCSSSLTPAFLREQTLPRSSTNFALSLVEPLPLSTDLPIMVSLVYSTTSRSLLSSVSP